MAFRIDEAELVQALDRRVRSALLTEWPNPETERSPSLSDHFDYLEVLELGSLPRDAALAHLVVYANQALFMYSNDVSEDAREPYGGEVAIDGDMLRVRYGRLPYSQPEDWHLAAELEPIPLRDLLIEE